MTSPGLYLLPSGLLWGLASRRHQKVSEEEKGVDIFLLLSSLLFSTMVLAAAMPLHGP